VQSLDLWSLGCIFYEMFVGYPPFFEFKDDQEKINAILEKDIEFSSISIPQANIRTAAIDFMKQCLNKDPEMRSSPESLIEHVFLCPN
jgi:serine/threonine protein kinase